MRRWYSLSYESENQPKWDSIRNDLMKLSDPESQVRAMEQLCLLSNSEPIPPHLLMPVIQYTATTQDHRLIKLFLFYIIHKIEVICDVITYVVR